MYDIFDNGGCAMHDATKEESREREKDTRFEYPTINNVAVLSLFSLRPKLF
jgi:hypothetical protein